MNDSTRSLEPPVGLSSALGWIVTRRTSLICALLATLPFWFVTIPPLTDVPGHMGRAAIAAQQNGPAFAALMGFQWYPGPNLGADLIVEALRHIVSITPAYWLVAAAIPLLLTVGLFSVARRLNSQGAAALPLGAAVRVELSV